MAVPKKATERDPCQRQTSDLRRSYPLVTYRIARRSKYEPTAKAQDIHIQSSDSSQKRPRSHECISAARSLSQERKLNVK